MQPMFARGPDGGGGGGGADLVIGLVNNTPPAALRATEAQFAGLLRAAARGRRIRLRCFAAGAVADPHYEGLDALWRSRLDGLIVTGAEPQAAAMTQEPAWPLLARLTDWAAANTDAAIWSCLAAHAAVFRLDGLARRRLPRKLSGVFACARAADHALVADAPTHWPVPHSRHNDLDAAALQAAGYLILSRGPGTTDADGADSFEKPAGRSLFLMLQGHPEYAADTLLQEYRRDVRRFLTGRRVDWPPSPEGYFDAATGAALTDLQARAAGRPVTELLAALDEIAKAPAPYWQPAAVRLYAGWLADLAARQAGHAPASRRAAS